MAKEWIDYYAVLRIKKTKPLAFFLKKEDAEEYATKVAKDAIIVDNVELNLDIEEFINRKSKI